MSGLGEGEGNYLVELLGHPQNLEEISSFLWEILK